MATVDEQPSPAPSDWYEARHPQVTPPLPPWATTFLNSLRKCGSPRYAARTAKVALRSVRRLAARRPDFKAQYATAKQHACALLEREAWRRAVHGVDEVTTVTRKDRQGDVVAVETKTRHVFSDAMLAKLLVANMAAKYAPQSRVETTIRDDTAISRAQLREMLKSPRKRELLAQLAEPDPPPGAGKPARAGYSAPNALAHDPQTTEVNNSGSQGVLTEPLGGDEAGVEAEPGDQGQQASPAGLTPAGEPLVDAGGGAAQA